MVESSFPACTPAAPRRGPGRIGLGGRGAAMSLISAAPSSRTGLGRAISGDRNQANPAGGFREMGAQEQPFGPKNPQKA